jgi:hypothetical protein
VTRFALIGCRVVRGGHHFLGSPTITAVPYGLPGYHPLVGQPVPTTQNGDTSTTTPRIAVTVRATQWNALKNLQPKSQGNLLSKEVLLITSTSAPTSPSAFYVAVEGSAGIEQPAATEGPVAVAGLAAVEGPAIAAKA